MRLVSTGGKYTPLIDHRFRSHHSTRWCCSRQRQAGRVRSRRKVGRWEPALAGLICSSITKSPHRRKRQKHCWPRFLFCLVLFCLRRPREAVHGVVIASFPINNTTSIDSDAPRRERYHSKQQPWLTGARRPGPERSSRVFHPRLRPGRRPS